MVRTDWGDAQMCDNDAREQTSRPSPVGLARDDDDDNDDNDNDTIFTQRARHQ